MKFVTRALIVCAAVGGVSAASFAQGTQGVELAGTVLVERTQTVDGVDKTVLVEPTNVVPGEQLVFTTRYRNNTGQPVENFVITNPLPDAVQLARAGDFEVSVDGGGSFGSLSGSTVSGADGASRPAQLADVTHLRWVLPSIASGASGEVEYHAVVR